MAPKCFRATPKDLGVAPNYVGAIPKTSVCSQESFKSFQRLGRRSEYFLALPKVSGCSPLLQVTPTTWSSLRTASGHSEDSGGSQCFKPHPRLGRHSALLRAIPKYFSGSAVLQSPSKGLGRHSDFCFGSHSEYFRLLPVLQSHSEDWASLRTASDHSGTQAGSQVLKSFRRTSSSRSALLGGVGRVLRSCPRQAVARGHLRMADSIPIAISERQRRSCPAHQENRSSSLATVAGSELTPPAAQRSCHCSRDGHLQDAPPSTLTASGADVSLGRQDGLRFPAEHIRCPSGLRTPNSRIPHGLSASFLIERRTVTHQLP